MSSRISNRYPQQISSMTNPASVYSHYEQAAINERQSVQEQIESVQQHIDVATRRLTDLKLKMTNLLAQRDAADQLAKQNQDAVTEDLFLGPASTQRARDLDKVISNTTQGNQSKSKPSTVSKISFSHFPDADNDSDYDSN